MFKRQEETPSASYGYWTVERVFPGSFTTPEHFDFDNPNEGDEYAFIYYSFVTLTTLGYGDVTPVHPVARTLAYLEAVIGQLFIAVLIAGLVGRRIANSGIRDRGLSES